jgi:rsbT antagonist protein RsbS
VVRVPIVHINQLLIATVLEDLHDSDALRLQEELGALIERTGARGVLLDFSVVDIVDSFLGRMINDISTGARLLGAHTVVVGIQPAVAMTLVELGLDLTGIRTALNPEKGFTILRQLIAAESWNGQRRGR